MPQHFLKNRREWFERMEEAWAALWWVPAGHHPDVAEARERLEHLRTHGDSPRAFIFRRLQPAPESAELTSD